MKKFLSLLLSLFLLSAILAGCAAQSEPTAESNSSAEHPVPVMSETSYASSEADVLLAELQAENEELKQQNASLQADLDALREQGVAFEDIEDFISIDYSHHFVTIRNENAEDHKYCETYYYTVNSSEKPKLILRNYLKFWNMSISPNGKRILFNDFEVEGGGRLYLYDIETEVANEIDFEGILEAYHYARFVGWLDDRYFLFVEGEDNPGTYGGNIYLYDTQASTCRELIKTENRDMRIRSFSVYNRNESWQEEQKRSIFFEIVISENANFAEERYAMLPMSEILSAIEKQSTVTIKSKDTF